LLPTTLASFAKTAETSEELLASYPALDSDRPGNPLILCPYLRMLERSGRLDEVLQNEVTGAVVRNRDLKRAAEEFGCASATACGPVIDAVSAGQHYTSNDNSFFSLFNPFRSYEVDLERLWDAPPVSHDCGFTFEQGLGKNGVSTMRLESTLTQLASKASDQNQLVYQDILDVKLGICEEEGVELTGAGRIEAELIFAYLGGIERGFVDYSDVEAFLQVNSTLPAVKAEQDITALYLLQVD